MTRVEGGRGGRLRAGTSSGRLRAGARDETHRSGRADWNMQAGMSRAGCAGRECAGTRCAGHDARDAMHPADRTGQSLQSDGAAVAIHPRHAGLDPASRARTSLRARGFFRAADAARLDPGSGAGMTEVRGEASGRGWRQGRLRAEPAGPALRGSARDETRRSERAGRAARGRDARDGLHGDAMRGTAARDRPYGTEITEERRRWPFTPVMPDLIRHPGRASPCARGDSLAPRTRRGWIPARGPG